MKVAILGASTKPDRYSHRAQKLLMARGYEVIPINPTGIDVLGIEGATQVPSGVDTLTLYIRPDRLLPMLDQIITAAPRRVIFNPGTESSEAAERMQQAGIETEEACTLILLDADQF